MSSFSSSSAGRISRDPNTSESNDQANSNGFEGISMRGYCPDSSTSEISNDDGGFQGSLRRGFGGDGRLSGLDNVNQQQNSRKFQQGIRAVDYEASNLEDYDGPSNQDRSESSTRIAEFMNVSSTNAEELTEMLDEVEAIEQVPMFDEATISDEEHDKIKELGQMSSYDIYCAKKARNRSYLTDEEMEMLTDESAMRSTASAPSESGKLDDDAKLILYRLANWERKAISFVDNILADKALNEEQLCNALIDNLGPFGNTRGIVPFIMIRPHLYEFNAQQRVAFRVDLQDREHHMDFLRYLGKKKIVGTTYPEMMSDLKIGQAGPYLQKIVQGGTFDAFFNRMNRLYYKSQTMDPSETRVQMRGIVFNSEGSEEIWLPGPSLGYIVA